MLLTNCHVVVGLPTIRILRDEEFYTFAELFSHDKYRDTCVLQAMRNVLRPIRRIKPFHGIDIGETVYAIGSPEGFTNTLSEGLVSGKRSDGIGNLIQTTAPISNGSSGGGLFDARANLIGITTWRIEGSGQINLAIPVDEFW
jgi:S1-C subfamily serine protease